MQTIWDRTLSSLLTIGALAIAAALVHREFFAQPPTSQPRVAAYDSDWQDALPAGRLVGNPLAGVKIVVFSDLECPFCQRFHGLLGRAQARHPDSLSYSFVHFPIPGHAFAPAAAHLAECASRSNKFAEAIDFIFANQDSLGTRDWQWFARGSGIMDSAGVAACLADTAMTGMISRGIDQGQKMNVTGTPAVFLNGWRYPGLPPEDEFMKAVDDLVAGKRPYPAFPVDAIRPTRR